MSPLLYFQGKTLVPDEEDYAKAAGWEVVQVPHLDSYSPVHIKRYLKLTLPIAFARGSVQFIENVFAASAIRPVLPNLVWPYTADMFHEHDVSLRTGHPCHNEGFDKIFLNPPVVATRYHNFDTFRTRTSYPIFARPESSRKEFEGTVFTEESQATLISDYWLSRHALKPRMAPVVTFPVQEIQEEFRCVVVGNQLLEGASYRVFGDTVASNELPKEVVAVANEFTAGVWKGQDHYVLDICTTPKGPKVIETNALHSSGFDCFDPVQIVNIYAALRTELLKTLQL